MHRMADATALWIAQTLPQIVASRGTAFTATRWTSELVGVLHCPLGPDVDLMAA